MMRFNRDTDRCWPCELSCKTTVLMCLSFRCEFHLYNLVFHNLKLQLSAYGKMGNGYSDWRSLTMIGHFKMIVY